MIGTRLAHYEITQHIGSGGMGEVYEATDSKLGRSVAIKLLPEAFARDAERIARLQREARALGALSHPNIAAIHAIEDSGERPFLVMELVSGETLAGRIQRGPIPLDEAIAIASQIAAALEAAHDAGIVHRDLKPANVKVSEDGKVKVLDFGLAKAATAVEPQPSVLDSPTLSLAATQRGVILGTAAYMSPEQARGKPADRRSDIWSFGVVLYEMVTGQRLFKGEDMTDTLAAVVREKPDLNLTPPAVRRVLEKCLERDPQKRLRHLSGFSLLLDDAGAERSVAADASARSRFALVAWTVAAVMAVISIVLAIVHFRETASESMAVQFWLEAPQELAFGNLFRDVAASPDGRYVVFGVSNPQGASQLWLRPLDSTAARPLPGTEDGASPTWSPDSKSLAFCSGGKLKRIETVGGAPMTLSETPGTQAQCSAGTWSRDGLILFGTEQGLRRVSASGGGATTFTETDKARKEFWHGYPQFLPDGNRFLYFIASMDPNVEGVYAASLSNPGQRQQILKTSAKAVFIPARHGSSDYLLWVRGQTLLAQRFALDTLRLEGDPVTVAEDLDYFNRTRSAAFSASEAGLLTYYASFTPLKRQVLWVDRNGKPIGEAVAPDTFSRVALAAGGERLAVVRFDPETPTNFDLRILELARGVMTRLTFDASRDDYLAWSPDGKHVAFSSNRDGTQQIYRKEASGAGAEERLTEGPNPKVILDWSTDGKYLLYREENPETGRDLMALPLQGARKPITVVRTPFAENSGAISPDGRWVAYASDDSGANEIYVQAFPGTAGSPAGRWQISSGGAYEVKWRADGKEIYYQSLDAKIMAAAVQTSPQSIRIETPRELFSANILLGGNLDQFDFTRDAQRFLLLLRPQIEGERLTIVSNWQAALRR